MKPRSLMAIVLIGTGLIAVAPTGEKAGQADKTGTPAQDVRAQQEDASREAQLQTASFSGDAPAPKDRGD